MKDLKVIDSRKINDGVDSYYTNIYFTPDRKELVLIDGEYYYLNKAGLKVLKKKYEMK